MRETFPVSASVGSDDPRPFWAETGGSWVDMGGRALAWLWIVVVSAAVLAVAVLVVIALAHHAPPAGGGA
jgi:hypothetical protein